MTTAFVFVATQTDGKVVPEYFEGKLTNKFEDLHDIEFFDLNGGEENTIRVSVKDYFLFHIGGGLKLGFGMAKRAGGTFIFERRQLKWKDGSTGKVLFAVGYEWNSPDEQYKMKQVALIDAQLGLVEIAVEAHPVEKG